MISKIAKRKQETTEREEKGKRAHPRELQTEKLQQERDLQLSKLNQEKEI